MGTPQTRCREMHQSGRVAIMFERRSSPQAGSHFTCLISSSVRVRRVSFSASTARPAGHGRFHGDEPLLGGAEDHGIVAAPAVRVGVLSLFRVQQSAAALEQVDDRLIRFPDALAGVLRQAVAQDAFFVDVAGGVETVLHAGEKVLRAVRGSGVDHAGARVHGDVVGEHAENLAVEETDAGSSGAPASRPGKWASSRGFARLHFSATSFASFEATM